MAGVLHDPDDGHPVPRRRVAAKGEASPNGIIDCRPESFGEEVVDHRRPRPVGCSLVRSEEAAVEQLDAHRREVIRAGNACENHRIFGVRARRRRAFRLIERAPVARKRRAGHARNPSDARDERFIKTPFVAAVLVLRVRHREPEAGHAIRPEAGIDVAKIGVGTDEQAAAPQEHRGEGDLEDDERVQHASLGERARGARAADERSGEILPSELQRRRETEHKCRRGDDQDRKRDRPRVDAEMQPRRNVGDARRQEPDAEPADDRSNDAGGRGEHQRLGEQLTGHPPATRA